MAAARPNQRTERETFAEMRQELVREIVATVTLVGVVIVLSGIVLALIGSVTLYGGSVGLYFITEATLLGHPTGIVFLQDYGPFVGPGAVWRRGLPIVYLTDV